jgi:hypothetical protein
MKLQSINQSKPRTNSENINFKRKYQFLIKDGKKELLGANGKKVIHELYPKDKVTVGRFLNFIIRDSLQEFATAVNWSKGQSAQHMRRHVHLWFDDTVPFARPSEGNDVLTLFTDSDCYLLKDALAEKNSRRVAEMFGNVHHADKMMVDITSEPPEKKIENYVGFLDKVYSYVGVNPSENERRYYVDKFRDALYENKFH